METASRGYLPGPALGRKSTDDFRQHFGFVALMVVCGACTVYLMGVLRSVLRPFLWALFLVMGLAPAVSLVERALLCFISRTCNCCTACAQCCCNAVRWICGWRRRSCQSKRDTDAVPSVIGSSVVDERRLSASSSALSGSDGVGGERDTASSGRFSDSSTKAWSPCTRFVVRTVSIGAVVAAVVCAIAGFVLMVVQSAVTVQDHWDVYRLGARRIAEAVQRLITDASGKMPREVADEISSNALLRAEEFISSLLTEILSNAWRAILEFLMMALYLAFWLSDPMPVGIKMEELFKRYIILKGLACLGYGVCVGVLLYVLSVDLAALFALAAFFLSFVPEVGAIVALMLPTPVILFDGRLESPFITLAIAMAAQLALKFVFANVVEVKLVEADQLMKMHPVIILLAVTFFGFIWGPTGMLLAVPLVAYLKMALLSDIVPPSYRDPVLVILEGDRNAPIKYHRRRSPSAASIPDAAGDLTAALSAGGLCDEPCASSGLRSTASASAIGVSAEPS